MYAIHQPQIGHAARSSPNALARVVVFTLCSIQCPLKRAASDVERIYRDDDTSPLFGSKINAYAVYMANKRDYYERAMAIWHHEPCERERETLLVDLFNQLPGIGVVKSGFIVQLAFGLAGCLDTHNASRFDLDYAWYRPRRYKIKDKAKRRARIAEYCEFIRRAGGTAALWDSWCEYVAAESRTDYKSAEQVSALHLAAIERN